MGETQTVRFRVYGIVQGVGFRPTVDRHAAAAGVTGSVCNKGPYVEIIAQGDAAALDSFRSLLRDQPPRRAAILKIDEKPVPKAQKYEDFRIVVSEKTDGEIYISPDIAICEECAQELHDPQNRRYLHPFINCTCCGPRLTILDALPYDRERTSMKMFPMCRTCSEEYHSPASRRYDAQPVCCSDCGPEVYLLPIKKDSEDDVPLGSGGFGTGERAGFSNAGLSDEKMPDGLRVRQMAAEPESEIQNAPAGMKAAAAKTWIPGGLRGREAVTAARREILAGGIVAVKGIGGFHLCCDATNEAAVYRLRVKKRRPAKPFAVMMRDERTVLRECELNAEQKQILTGHQKPILLLDRKDAGGSFSADKDPEAENRRAKDVMGEAPKSLLAPSVAPGNPKIGVMLPYTPLHMLLFQYDDDLKMPDCLVMTSGNVSGAPICRDDADVLAELSDFCDCILSHNRLIRIRADDTVMDFHRGHPYMIRRSRGYAPLPVLLSEEGRGEGCVLAIGGELKNTFCIASGNLYYLSPYIGDLEDLRTVRALKETVGRMESLLEVKPSAIVCDLHPKYNSTMAAEELAAERGIPLYRIQHHYAHVLACMAENDRTDPVIGVSFDGTGYGEDGTIWGGEILVTGVGAKGKNVSLFTGEGEKEAGAPRFAQTEIKETGSPRLTGAGAEGTGAPRFAETGGYFREYSIFPFIQIGGDSAPRQGWRIAASMIWSLCKREAAALAAGKADQESPGAAMSAEEAYFDIIKKLALCDEQNAKAQRMMAERRIQAVNSTSAGRLFDAVSAMLGICRESTYEGEASIELQFAAERFAERFLPSNGNLNWFELFKKSGIIEREIIESGRIESEIIEKEGLFYTREISEAEEISGVEKISDTEGIPDIEDSAVEKNTEENAEENAAAGEGKPRRLATDRLFSALLKKKLTGEDPEKLAFLFHIGLAGQIVRACAEISSRTGLRTAALTGGCFQNRLLLSLVEDGLSERGMEVLIHHLVPPNDGGIALGQALAVRLQG